jgi:hypothetical protein
LLRFDAFTFAFAPLDGFIRESSGDITPQLFSRLFAILFDASHDGFDVLEIL